MATVGALSIDLSANSAAFARDMGRARTSLVSGSARMNRSLARLDRGFLKLGRSVGRNLKRMVNFRTALATVAGGAGIGLLIKSSIKAADTIAKTADKIGFTTDALQELRFASDIAGVSQNTLDLALQRFSRRLGEAVQGSGELKGTLEQYGIAVTDASGRTRSADAVLTDLARAIRGATSDQERLRIAFKAFDSEGAALVNVMRLGAEGMNALRTQARELGLVIDEKLLRAAEVANDKLTILAGVIKAKVITAVVRLAPEIADLAQTFAEGIPKLVNWIKEFGVFVGLIERAPVERLREIKDRIDEINKKLAEAPANPITDFLQLDISTGQVQRLREELEKLRLERKAIVSDIAREQGGIRTPAAATAASPGAAPGAAGVGGSPVGAATGSFRAAQEQSLAEAIELATAHQKILDDMAARGKAVFEETRLPAEVLTSSLGELNNLLKSGNIDWQTYARAVENAKEKFRETDESTRRFEDTIVRLGDGLVDSLSSGEGAFESFGRTVISVLVDIQKELIRTALRAQFAEEGGGFLGTIFKAILGGLAGGIGGGDAGLGPQFTGTDIRGSGSFAHGGRPRVGQAALVGERGPELFVPDRAGTIVPNGQLGGGVVINQSFDFRGADAGVFTKAQEFKEQIKAETVATVFGLINQGGSEAKLSGRRKGRR